VKQSKVVKVEKNPEAQSSEWISTVDSHVRRISISHSIKFLKLMKEGGRVRVNLQLSVNFTYDRIRSVITLGETEC
jgi:hypothetical protein